MYVVLMFLALIFFCYKLIVLLFFSTITHLSLFDFFSRWYVTYVNEYILLVEF